MFLICIYTTKRLYIYFHTDQYNQDLIRYYGGAYVGNDLLALLIVDKLPKTTIIHHKLSVFMYYMLITFDINKIFILKLLVLYTFFSYYAFMVNLYLGLRYFIQEKNFNNEENKNLSKTFNTQNLNSVIDYVRISAYYNYLICCSLNWSVHSYFLLKRIYLNLFGCSEFIYCLLLVPIIRDDLILMSWLRKKYVSLD